MDVPQLLIAVDADENREEDAGDLPEDGEELQSSAAPHTYPARRAREQDVLNVHDHDLLQIRCGQSEEKDLEGLQARRMKDGEDQERVSYNAEDGDDDPQSEKIHVRALHR